MNITLGKEFERRIIEKVADGLYTSARDLRGSLKLFCKITIIVTKVGAADVLVF